MSDLQNTSQVNKSAQVPCWANDFRVYFFDLFLIYF